jgi:2-oxoglutarate ferredoxin oxidoreductase subunit beta
MKYYKEASKVRNGAPTGEVALTKEGEIVVGKFVDRERPDYMDSMRGRLSDQLGERYVQECGVCS